MKRTNHIFFAYLVPINSSLSVFKVEKARLCLKLSFSSSHGDDSLLLVTVIKKLAFLESVNFLPKVAVSDFG